MFLNMSHIYIFYIYMNNFYIMPFHVGTLMKTCSLWFFLIEAFIELIVDYMQLI